MVLRTGLLFGLFCAGTAFSQAPSGGVTQWVMVQPGSPMSQRVVGAPYSAEELNEHVQTLADGTHISEKTRGNRVYRDSEGRTRTERLAFNSTDDTPVSIDIFDPVAHVHYSLDTRTKTARKLVLPGGTAPPLANRNAGVAGNGVLGGIIGAVPSAAPPPPPPPPATAAKQARRDPAMRPKVSSESLPAQTVEGVLAEGRRFTTTYPVDSVGNDREFSTYNETWTSPDLKIMVMTKSSDPRSGDRIFRLTNLRRAEPDASLFSVPGDYSIREQ